MKRLGAHRAWSVGGARAPVLGTMVCSSRTSGGNSLAMVKMEMVMVAKVLGTVERPLNSKMRMKRSTGIRGHPRFLTSNSSDGDA